MIGGRILLGLLIVSLASAAVARPAFTPATSMAAPGLRGVVAPAPSTPAKAPPSSLAVRPPDPRLGNPAPMVSPRVTGWTAAAGGGGQCRSGCAQSLYFCIAQDDAEQCAPRWTQCLTACPTVTSDSL